MPPPVRPAFPWTSRRRKTPHDIGYRMCLDWPITVGGVEVYRSLYMKHKVSLETNSLKLAAAEDFLEDCFNRRRASERRCNICATAWPCVHVLLCEILREIAKPDCHERNRKSESYLHQVTPCGHIRSVGCFGKTPVFLQGLLTKSGAEIASGRWYIWSCGAWKGGAHRTSRRTSARGQKAEEEMLGARKVEGLMSNHARV